MIFPNPIDISTLSKLLNFRRKTVLLRVHFASIHLRVLDGKEVAIAVEVPNVVRNPRAADAASIMIPRGFQQFFFAIGNSIGGTVLHIT